MLHAELAQPLAGGLEGTGLLLPARREVAGRTLARDREQAASRIASRRRRRPRPRSPRRAGRARLRHRRSRERRSPGRPRTGPGCRNSRGEGYGPAVARSGAVPAGAARRRRPGAGAPALSSTTPARRKALRSRCSAPPHSNSTAISGVPPRCGAIASRTAPPTAWCSKNAALSAARTVDLPSSLSPETTINPSPRSSRTTGPASLRNWAISIRRSLMRATRDGDAQDREAAAPGLRLRAAPGRRRPASASSRATVPTTGEPARSRRSRSLGSASELVAQPPDGTAPPDQRSSSASSAARVARSTAPVRVSWTSACSRPAAPASSAIERGRRIGDAGKIEIELPPGMAGGGQARDPRRSAGLVELDQQRVAGIVGAEAVGFGRAGVPGARGDLERAVPVAQGQIVETGTRRHARGRSG